MLDHIFLTVSDIDRSIAFYERVLPILGVTSRLDYDGKNGPAGHPDLWLPARPTFIHLDRSFTTILAITRRRSETWTATASNLFIKAGSTRVEPQ